METEPKLDTEQIQLETITNNLERIMSEWTKMPDSWITPNEYDVGKEKILESKDRNKFRGQYFTTIIVHCNKLVRLICADNKEIGKKIANEIEILRQKINKARENEAPITEDLIDEVDNFAKELIKKIKYEQNQN